VRRLIVLVSVTVLAVAGCASPPPTVCDQYLCEGPAYWPDTATQIENGVVAVFSAIGVVPIVPRSANGPARRTSFHTVDR
jgi:hypothetical protein